jgi:hypothetical protein
VLVVDNIGYPLRNPKTIQLILKFYQEQ